MRRCAPHQALRHLRSAGLAAACCTVLAGTAPAGTAPAGTALTSTVLATPVLAAGAAGAQAQTRSGPVPVDQDPSHRIVLSAPTFRILEVEVLPGARTLEHLHDRDLLTVNTGIGTTRTRTTGQDWGTPRVRRLGETTVAEYTGRPAAHVVENIDDVAYRLVGVENLRPGGWTSHAAVTVPGQEIVLESRAFRAADVRLPRDGETPVHTHPVPTLVVLVSGAATAGGGAPGVLRETGAWRLVPADEAHALEAAPGAEAYVVEVEIR